MPQGFVFELSAARKRNHFGKKAENLHFLSEKGYRVPKTFVIPFDAQMTYLVDPGRAFSLLLGELEGKIEEGRGYAVRSSANLEDSSKHSFAGQFRTYLDLHGARDVAEAIKGVWQSAQQESPRAYMQRSEQKASEVKMGVIVQEMVHQSVSGVSFSRNPVNGKDEVVIEAVRGSGEALVQHGVTPSRWIISGKRFLSRPSADGIDENIILSVAELTERVAGDYNAPVDIEWVFDGRELILVQLRGITSRSEVQVYSNNFSKEVLPGLIKPLIWSVNVPLVNGAWVRFLEELTGVRGLKIDELAKRFYGRAYFNMSAFGLVWERMGMPKDSLEQLMGVGGSKGGFKFEMTPKMLGITPNMMSFLLHHMFLSAELERFIPRKRSELNDFARDDLAKLSEEELLARAGALTMAMNDPAYYMVITALAPNLLNRMLESRLRKAGVDPSQVDMLKGLKEIHAYYPNEGLRELHSLFLALPADAQEDLCREGVGTLESAPGFNGFKQRFQAFMAAFGHVSESGNDFSKKPWREDPGFVLSLVIQFPDQKPEMKERQGVEELAIPSGRRGAIMSLHNKVRKFALLKERMSATYSYGYGLHRNYFMELGRRFASHKVIAAPEDVFYLSLDEVRQTVAGGCSTGTCNNYQLRVMMRKREMADYLDIDPPSIIYGDVAPPMTKGEELKLQGTPTSGGYYRGRARVIRSASEFHKLEEGDVLVIPYSDVAWTPLFSKAGAVVAESGGMLSHTSIIAREYGIPAVVSVGGALKLPDGAEVTVDGYNGLVLLEASEAAK